MLTVFEIIFPIYALIGLSFVVTRRGLFSQQDLQTLGRFIVTLGFPALIFTSITSRPLSETVQLPYVACYALGTLVAMAIMYAAFRKRYDHKTATLATMGSTCPNSGFVGYPIMLLAMPGLAAPVLAQNILVENLLFLPLLLTALELGDTGDASRGAVIRRVAWRVLTNPMVVAILAALAFSATGLRLPEVLNRPLDMLAAACGAVALSVIGGNLALLKPKGVRTLAGYIVIGKLLVQPLVVLGFILLVATFGLSDLPDPMRKALILTAAMPTLSMFPVLAQRHGREGFASAALFGTTLGGLFTLSALLLILA
jgi:predicted permease